MFTCGRVDRSGPPVDVRVQPWIIFRSSDSRVESVDFASNGDSDRAIGGEQHAHALEAIGVHQERVRHRRVLAEFMQDHGGLPFDSQHSAAREAQVIGQQRHRADDRQIRDHAASQCADP